MQNEVRCHIEKAYAAVALSLIGERLNGANSVSYGNKKILPRH